METLSCKLLDMNLGDVLSLNIVQTEAKNRPTGEVLGNIYRLDWNTQGCQRGKCDTQSHMESVSLCPNNGKPFLSEYSFLI